MADQDEEGKLQALNERRISIEQEIDRLDLSIEIAERGVREDGAARWLSQLSDLSRRQAGFFLELGRVQQQIEDSQQLGLERVEAGREGAALEAWERQDAQGDDFLDHLRAPVDGMKEEQSQETSQERDDDLDWLKTPDRDERR